MILYLTIIIVFSIVCAILGCFVAVPMIGVSYGSVFAAIGLCLLGLFIVDAVVAIVVRLLPKKLYNPFKKLYKVSEKERKFYDKIKIRAWKDKIPETGGLLVGFSKTKVADMTNNEYVEKFMYETVYAEVMHFVSIPFSFLVSFIYPKLFLFVGLILIIGNILLQLMPVMVQRYNRYKLMILHKRNSRRIKVEEPKE